jgi:hypothetical protein
MRLSKKTKRALKPTLGRNRDERGIVPPSPRPPYSNLDGFSMNGMSTSSDRLRCR